MVKILKGIVNKKELKTSKAMLQKKKHKGQGKTGNFAAK